MMIPTMVLGLLAVQGKSSGYLAYISNSKLQIPVQRLPF